MCENGTSGELGIKHRSACSKLVVWVNVVCKIDESMQKFVRAQTVTVLLDLIERIEKWELWVINGGFLINHKNKYLFNMGLNWKIWE